jgi:hypothetical protein
MPSLIIIMLHISRHRAARTARDNAKINPQFFLTAWPIANRSTIMPKSRRNRRRAGGGCKQTAINQCKAIWQVCQSSPFLARRVSSLSTALLMYSKIFSLSPSHQS